MSARKRSAPGREIAGEALDVKDRFTKVGNPIPLQSRNPHATAGARTKEGRFYKPLPKEFRRNGFRYRQVARQGNAAIYEQTWNGCQNPSVAYEVIRIRCREGFQISGRFVEPAEIYPNSEAWGVDGFTISDKDAAFQKLKQMY
jgi:hypothetical protein